MDNTFIQASPNSGIFGVDPDLEIPDLDLRAVGDDGSIVGTDPNDRAWVVQIPGAAGSGDSQGGGPEWISLPSDVSVKFMIDASEVSEWLIANPDIDPADVTVTAENTETTRLIVWSTSIWNSNPSEVLSTSALITASACFLLILILFATCSAKSDLVIF